MHKQHLLSFPVQCLRPAIDLQPPLSRRFRRSFLAAAVARAVQLLIVSTRLPLPGAVPLLHMCVP